MFLDEARITVRAGDGGNGSNSQHREKFVPKGGPDGAEGGLGGSIFFEAVAGIDTLNDFRQRRIVEARPGKPGAGNNCRGGDAEDVVVSVPVGTIVRADDGEILADLGRAGSRYRAARGGAGGRGNAALASRADVSPNFSEPGEPGEQFVLRLELRLVADVGFLGLPNAGKSTLLGALTAARPKVANYPFTTLEPHLGVVSIDDDTHIVLADLPGLIEGAAAGKGLGTKFLRHAERCAVLAAVVDLAADDPVADLETAYREAVEYDPALAARVHIVVANKADLGGDIEQVRSWALEHGADCVSVSALNGDVGDLADRFGALVAESRARQVEAESFAVFRPEIEDRIEVAREDGAAFRVRSTRVERAVVMTSLGNPRAVRHLQRQLRAMGVEAALVKAGVKEGEEVRIGEHSFEYHAEP